MTVRDAVRAIVHCACPHCGAQPGRRCREITLWTEPRSLRELPPMPHPQRLAAFERKRGGAAAMAAGAP
jgi:hypothetical protein